MVLEQYLFSKLQCKKEMKLLFHMKLSCDSQQFKAKSNETDSQLSAKIIEQKKKNQKKKQKNPHDIWRWETRSEIGAGMKMWIWKTA